MAGLIRGGCRRLGTAGMRSLAPRLSLRLLHRAPLAASILARFRSITVLGVPRRSPPHRLAIVCTQYTSKQRSPAPHPYTHTHTLIRHTPRPCCHSEPTILPPIICRSGNNSGQRADGQMRDVLEDGIPAVAPLVPSVSVVLWRGMEKASSRRWRRLLNVFEIQN